MKEGYIYIESSIFPTLLAISDVEQERGLMHVSWPPPVMTFVYESPKINKFWMHNTPSPLDIVFCLDGKITQICKGEPFSTEIIGGNKYSDLVIEFPIGTMSALNIKLGHSVGLIKPSLAELKIHSQFKYT